MNQRKHNLIYALTGVLPGLWVGLTLSGHHWGGVACAIVAYLLSFVFLEYAKISSRWGRAILVALLSNYAAALIRSASILHHEGRDLISHFGKYLFASGILSIFTITSWIVAFFGFVIIDYIISLALKPKNSSKKDGK